MNIFILQERVQVKSYKIAQRIFSPNPSFFILSKQIPYVQKRVLNISYLSYNSLVNRWLGALSAHRIYPHVLISQTFLVWRHPYTEDIDRLFPRHVSRHQAGAIFRKINPFYLSGCWGLPVIVIWGQEDGGGLNSLPKSGDNAKWDWRSIGSLSLTGHLSEEGDLCKWKSTGTNLCLQQHSEYFNANN